MHCMLYSRTACSYVVHAMNENINQTEIQYPSLYLSFSCFQDVAQDSFVPRYQRCFNSRVTHSSTFHSPWMWICRLFRLIRPSLWCTLSMSSSSIRHSNVLFYLVTSARLRTVDRSQTKSRKCLTVEWISHHWSNLKLLYVFKLHTRKVT